jgi:hypothetical protein
MAGWWWLEHDWIMNFHSVGNFMIPTGPNSMIFRGVAKNHQPVDILMMLYVRDLEVWVNMLWKLSVCKYWRSLVWYSNMASPKIPAFMDDVTIWLPIYRGFPSHEQLSNICDRFLSTHRDQEKREKRYKPSTVQAIFVAGTSVAPSREMSKTSWAEPSTIYGSFCYWVCLKIGYPEFQ